MKRPEVGAKELFAQRASFEIVGFHIGRDGLVAFAHHLKPGAVMGTQRLAPSEANKPRAVALIFIPCSARLVKLHLGYVNEPAAEIVAIIGRTQFGGVWNAVTVGIGPDRRGWNRGFRSFSPGLRRLPAAESGEREDDDQRERRTSPHNPNREFIQR